MLSVVFNAAHLIALHFDLLPALLPPTSSSSTRYATPQPDNALPSDPAMYLLALLTAAAQTVAWLGQASLCTACELSPVLAGNQGLVPQWCPQSKFRDTGNIDLPKMLAQLAIVKDTSHWVMVPLSAVLVECGRRQWARSRIAAVEAQNFDPGLREYDWKNGVTVATVAPSEMQDFELGPVPGKSKPFQMANPGENSQNAVEIGMPPSRQVTFENPSSSSNAYGRANGSGNGKQGNPVRQGLDVGMSYESRI